MRVVVVLVNRDRIIEALDVAAPADLDPLNHAVYVPAVKALIGEAVDETLEAAAQHLQGEAERESTGSRHLYLSQAAAIVRSRKGDA